MMNSKDVGAYLNRRIVLQEVSSLKEITTTNLSSAVLLLWLDDHLWKPEELRAAIEELADGKVLSLVVAGERADESFSTLLETLSYLPTTTYHIMTGVIKDTNMGEAVSEFLVATYPDELRFDDWQEYRIIAVGDLNSHKQMLYSINKVINELDS